MHGMFYKKQIEGRSNSTLNFPFLKQVSMSKKTVAKLRFCDISKLGFQSCTLNMLVISQEIHDLVIMFVHILLEYKTNY